MSSSILNPASTTTAARTRRVTDAPTRVFHWLFALCFTGAYLTAESEHWRLVHVTLGYTFAGLLVFRLVWGLIGPRQARLGLMARKLSGLRTWIDGLRAGRPNGRQAQNLGMTATVLALMIAVVPVTLSGYASENEWGGDWLGQLHGLIGDGLLALAIAHVGLIALLSLLRRTNLARPMLTGRIPGAGPDLARRNHGLVAALVIAAVVGFWVLQAAA
ncbi:cytochrome b/b6 domain-containing protein [Sphaerotilus sp.]|uniref:cytochrome b/b6 domain-containing protein n=1 Tax=Sphaerotilus sp. TaxID=2093942 RepID=UPI0034E2FD5F